MSAGDAERWAALRRVYAQGGLTEDDLADDPLTMFDRWLREAITAHLPEPNAMVLSTVSADGRPSSRMVLCKGADEDGFVFFTNTESRKGREIAGNPQVTLLFPWHPLERQVRIDGTASPLSRAEVEAYFETRPRGAQVGAWASPQSQPVAGREELAELYAAQEARHGDGSVPVPPQWGGYRVRPESVEFWQGRPGRMHDRLVHVRQGDGWRVERLAP